MNIVNVFGVVFVVIGIGMVWLSISNSDPMLIVHLQRRVATLESLNKSNDEIIRLKDETIAANQRTISSQSESIRILEAYRPVRGKQL